MGRELGSLLDGGDGRCAGGIGEMVIRYLEHGTARYERVFGEGALSELSRVQWIRLAPRHRLPPRAAPLARNAAICIVLYKEYVAAGSPTKY